MFKYIEENPFRILGVFANSPKKDIVASKSKISAFIRIGRNVEFPNDLNNLIKSKLNRTNESVENAESQLALPKDILKHAMFWFVKVTPLDNIALNHLCSDNIEMALSIWEKSDNVSSLQNRVVAYLINNQLDNSGRCAEKLYFEHPDEFLSMVGCETLKPSSYDLFNLYLECICNDPKTKYSILEIASELENDALREQIQSIPVEEYFQLIENAIAKAESIQETKGPNARLQAGITLKKETDKYLHELIELNIYNNSTRYQIVIDKLANEILQCGIDYYNESEDVDAPTVALSLMEYACQIAVGPSQKNRCEENTATVRQAANELPSQEVVACIKSISKLVDDSCIRLDLFKAEIRKLVSTGNYVEPHVSCTRGAQLAVELMSAIRLHIIKLLSFATTAIDVKNSSICLELFTDISRFVMNATIADVNSAWKEGVEDTLLNRNTRVCTLLTIIFKNGWTALHEVALLPLDKESKDRLQKNIQTLKEIIDEFDNIMRVVDSSRNSFDNPSYIFVDPMFFFEDDKYFSNCKTEYDLKRYIKLFPSGKHHYIAVQKIIKIETDRRQKEEEEKKRREIELKNKLEQARIAAAERAKQEERDNKIKQLAASATNIDMIAMALQAHGGDTSGNILDHKGFSLCKNRKDYERYLQIFPSGKHRQDAQKKIEDDSTAGAAVFGFIIIILVVIFILTYGICSGPLSKNTGSNTDIVDTDTLAADTVCIDSMDTYTSTSSIYSDSYKNTGDSYPATDSYTRETPVVDKEYETYKDNQLRNGSQPYADWYGYNSTFDEYDYHSEINITAPDATDVIVLVKRNDTNGVVVGHVYIRKGRKATIHISNGTRQVFFYYGNGWNPNKNMPGGISGGFVTDESVSKDDPIYFNNNVLTYTLKSVVNGNFQTKRSSMSEAF